MSELDFDQQLKQFKKILSDALKKKDRTALEELLHEGFYLVDERGEVFDKPGWLKGILQSGENYGKYFSSPFLRVKFQAIGGTIREVCKLGAAGQAESKRDAGQAVEGYICTALYLNESGNKLRLFSQTITKIEEPRINKPFAAPSA